MPVLLEVRDLAIGYAGRPLLSNAPPLLRIAQGAGRKQSECK